MSIPFLTPLLRPRPPHIRAAYEDGTLILTSPATGPGPDSVGGESAPTGCLLVPTGYDRVARLEDLRTDMTGWGHVDLGTLLAAWGFRERSLGVSFGRQNVLWSHPDDAARLNVVLPSMDGIAPRIVARAVWVIDQVRQAPSKSEDR